MDPRVVRAYLQAGRWLGLIELGEDTWLTPLGLEYAYAEQDRPAIYARAVWSTPFVATLMEGRDPDEVPSRDAFVGAIAVAEPELSSSTVKRRATALRGLVAPGLGPASRAPIAHQLDLPLPPVTPDPVAPRLDLAGRPDGNPDAYRYLLAHLVDHGELTLGHVRGLLDLAGAPEAPIGGYIDLALTRGDATRYDDRLVVSHTAVAHADLANSTPSVILSDPGYRAWLADLLRADRDRLAQIRRSQKWTKLMPWDRRLFGRPASSETLVPDLERVLMERSLDSFPVRGEPGEPPARVDEPFLFAWDVPGLLLCLPPSLLALRGGLGRVNDLLRRARQGQTGVGAPDLAHRPSIAHGGLLHPGESLIRSVPDTRSLRLRLLMNAPYVGMATALLLLHRLDSGRIEVRERRGRWMVRVRRRRVGALLPVLDGFARASGHVASRRPDAGVAAGTLLQILEQLGMAALVAGRAVLAEPFFGYLRREAEELQVYGALQPLASALSDHLHTLPRHEETPGR